MGPATRSRGFSGGRASLKRAAPDVLPETAGCEWAIASDTVSKIKLWRGPCWLKRLAGLDHAVDVFSAARPDLRIRLDYPVSEPGYLGVQANRPFNLPIPIKSTPSSHQ